MNKIKVLNSLSFHWNFPLRERLLRNKLNSYDVSCRMLLLYILLPLPICFFFPQEVAEMMG